MDAPNPTPTTPDLDIRPAGDDDSQPSGLWACAVCGAVTTDTGKRFLGDHCFLCGGTLSR